MLAERPFPCASRCFTLRLPVPGGVTEHIAWSAAGLDDAGTPSVCWLRHRPGTSSSAACRHIAWAALSVFRTTVRGHASPCRWALPARCGRSWSASGSTSSMSTNRCCRCCPWLSWRNHGPPRSVPSTRTGSAAACTLWACGLRLILRTLGRADRGVGGRPRVRRPLLPGRVHDHSQRGGHHRLPTGFEPLPACRGRGPKILFVGRLEKRKGFIHLLRAFAEVAHALPHARLFVAGAYGAGEQRRFVALARRLGVRNVSFLGPLARPTSPAATQVRAWFCAPSIEGEKLRDRAARSNGVRSPGCLPDIAGYHDVVRNDIEGLLVPRPGDEHALARALLRILRDDALVGAAWAMRDCDAPRNSTGRSSLGASKPTIWRSSIRWRSGRSAVCIDLHRPSSKRLQVTMQSDRAVNSLPTWMACSWTASPYIYRRSTRCSPRSATRPRLLKTSSSGA